MSDINGFDKKRWTVFTDDRGQHILMSPNGEHLYDVVETVTTDQAGETAYCKAIVAVNLVKSRQDALEGYGVKTPENG